MFDIYPSVTKGLHHHPRAQFGNLNRCLPEISGRTFIILPIIWHPCHVIQGYTGISKISNEPIPPVRYALFKGQAQDCQGKTYRFHVDFVDASKNEDDFKGHELMVGKATKRLNPWWRSHLVRARSCQERWTKQWRSSGGRKSEWVKTTRYPKHIKTSCLVEGKIQNDPASPRWVFPFDPKANLYGRWKLLFSRSSAIHLSVSKGF